MSQKSKLARLLWAILKELGLEKEILELLHKN